MKIKIKINFLSILADFMGKEEMAMEVPSTSTIEDIIKDIKLKLRENLKNKIENPDEIINKYILFSVNGKDLRNLSDISKRVNENDEITLLPAIAGG
ncbi:MAG: MoaD/ThiS family protein [Promethearchaeota archaeon]